MDRIAVCDVIIRRSSAVTKATARQLGAASGNRRHGRQCNSQPSAFRPPAAEDESAYHHAEQRSPHVYAKQWPRIRFECREDGDGRVFHKHKREPAPDGDFQATPDAFGIGPSDQDRERVIDNDRRDEREEIRPELMRVLDVGYGFGVEIEPDIAPDRVPAPTDQEIKNDENPNGEMINSNLHYKRSKQDLLHFYEAVFLTTKGQKAHEGFFRDVAETFAATEDSTPRNYVS